MIPAIWMRLEELRAVTHKGEKIRQLQKKEFVVRM
jgi:hypothetical protein